MAEDILVPIKVETEGVSTVGQLRARIAELKGELENVNIESEDYRKKLGELNTAQRDLKNTLNASTKTYNDILSTSELLSGSYRDMSQRMYDLKKAQKEVDLSTDEGREKFNAMAKDINAINDRLKELDASNGVYVRNVGNYANSFKAAFTQMGGATQKLTQSAATLNMGFKTLSANPIMIAFTALAGIINGVVKGFQSSETAMNKLAPVMGIINASTTKLTKVFQQLANWIGDAVGWVTKLADKLGLLGDATKENIAIVEEENAINQRRREIQTENAKIDAQVAELRNKNAQKDKYTEAERKKYLEEAIALEKKKQQNDIEIAQREYDLISRKSDLADNSAKENDELAAAEARLSQAMAAGEQSAMRLNSQYASLAGNTGNVEEAARKAAEEMERLRKAQSKEYLRSVAEANTEAANEAAFEQARAEVEAREYEVDAMLDLEEQLAEGISSINADLTDDIEAANKARIASYEGYADAASDVLGSVADLIENAAGEDAKSANAVKGIRIASATIETIHGAIAAYMKAQETYSPPAGQIIGGANAAAVTAAGLAQIAKIKNTSISASGSTSTATASASGYSVSSPSVDTSYTAVRNVIGATTEERLNAAASPQRVYILSSDIEASQSATRARVSETSF